MFRKTCKHYTNILYDVDLCIIYLINKIKFTHLIDRKCFERYCRNRKSSALMRLCYYYYYSRVWFTAFKLKTAYCVLRINFLHKFYIEGFLGDLFSVLGFRNLDPRCFNLVLFWTEYWQVYAASSLQVECYITYMAGRCLFRQWPISRSTVVLISFLFNCRSSSVLAVDGLSINMSDCLAKTACAVFPASPLCRPYKFVSRSLFC